MFKKSNDVDVYNFVKRIVREKVLYIERYEILVACVDIPNFSNERERILCRVFVGNMGLRKELRY